MSKFLKELFGLAMDDFPYVSSPDMDAAEDALEAYLGKEGKSLLLAYESAWDKYCWKTAEQAFYIALSLDIELATFTPPAGASRR